MRDTVLKFLTLPCLDTTQIYFQHMYVKKRMVVFKGNCVTVFAFMWQSTSPFLCLIFNVKNFYILCKLRLGEG